MKKIFFFYATCLLSLFTGCAPKVITTISNSHHPATSATQVRVYGVNDSVPQAAELIGKVKVVDAGLFTRCSYDQVIDLAKKKTAENGGNALALTQHRRPSMWSSCHRISGNMLFLKHPQSDAAFAASRPSMPSVEENCDCKDTTPFKHHSVYVQVGYSFIASKFYVPSEFTGHPKSGIDWLMGYDWVARNGFGVGLLYSGYHSTYAFQGNSSKILLSYVAPQLILKQRFREWSLEEKLGVGYFNYREVINNKYKGSLSGPGVNFLLGAEYHLSEYAGIVMNIGTVTGFLSYDDLGFDVMFDKDDATGIFRVHGNVGLRFHF